MLFLRFSFISYLVFGKIDRFREMLIHVLFCSGHLRKNTPAWEITSILASLQARFPGVYIQNLLPFLMDNKVQIGQPICVILISVIHTRVFGISAKMVQEHGLLYSQPQSNLGLVVSLNGSRMDGMLGVQQS